MGTPRIDSLDRNFFINGGMDYNQRRGTNGTGFQTGVRRYELDRWTVERNGNWNQNGVIRRQPVTVPGQPLLKFAQQFDTHEATDATATFDVGQRIESIFAKHLADKKASFSFFYNESEFQQVQVEFSYADSIDNFASATIFHIEVVDLVNDSSWNQIKIEGIDIPATAINGLFVKINFINPENTGVAITTQLTGVKLNIGTKAQEFSLAGRDLVEELQLCQRYYEKSYNLDVEPGTVTYLGTTANISDVSTSYNITTFFKTQKRAIPTATIYNPQTGLAGSIRIFNTNQADAASEVSENGFNVTGASGGNGSRYFYYQWIADAEL